MAVQLLFVDNTIQTTHSILSSTFLWRTFGEKERRGNPFYEKLSLPTEYKEKLLHGQIIATGKVPTQKVLNQSYGFRVPDSVAARSDNVFDITCHEDFRPVDERHPTSLTRFHGHSERESWSSGEHESWSCHQRSPQKDES